MEARCLAVPSVPSPAGIYRRLHQRYGDLNWWPASGPFEVMVGTVLTQRTAWRNVEAALTRLGEAGIGDVDTLMALPLGELEELIRPSGTYRQKALRLRELFTRTRKSGDGSLEAFLDRPVDQLRRDLLEVRGIGPETADSIILYAAGLPVFVVDTYTRRILGRLGIDPGRSYDEVATWFTSYLPADVRLYNNYHALLVELAKDHCRTGPRCAGCPLQDACVTGLAYSPK